MSPIQLTIVCLALLGLLLLPVNSISTFDFRSVDDLEADLDLLKAIEHRVTQRVLERIQQRGEAGAADEISKRQLKRKMFWSPLGYAPAAARVNIQPEVQQANNQEQGRQGFRYG